MATRECLPRLTALGISYEDACALRRISMTLRRWYELECGVDGGCIERDGRTGKPRWYNSRARYLDPHDPRQYSAIPDRERGAQKRLVGIMARYPHLGVYLQTDPRGASVYILRPGDVPAGSNVESCYSNGIAVYE